MKKTGSGLPSRVPMFFPVLAAFGAADCSYLEHPVGDKVTLTRDSTVRQLVSDHAHLCQALTGSTFEVVETYKSGFDGVVDYYVRYSDLGREEFCNDPNNLCLPEETSQPLCRNGEILIMESYTFKNLQKEEQRLLADKQERRRLNDFQKKLLEDQAKRKQAEKP